MVAVSGPSAALTHYCGGLLLHLLLISTCRKVSEKNMRCILHFAFLAVSHCRGSILNKDLPK